MDAGAMSGAIQGYQYNALNWSMVALTFIVVLIRLYVRVYLHGPLLSRETYRWSEFFVVLGWILYLGVAICDTIKIEAGSKNLTAGFKMTDAQQIRFMKAQFGWSWMYKPSIYMMKYALLFFYVELVHQVQNRKIWIAIVTTAVLNTIGLVGQWLFIALQCIPVHKQWSLTDNECSNMVAYPAFTWSFHVLTDVLVFALPFALLKSTLQPRGRGHTKGELSGAVIMFGLGIINVLSAIVVMALRLQPENYLDRPETSLGEATAILYTVQIATAIAIPCCPQVRIFYKHLTGHYDREKARVVTNTYISTRSRSRTRAGSVSKPGKGWKVETIKSWKVETSSSGTNLCNDDGNNGIELLDSRDGQQHHHVRI